MLLEKTLIVTQLSCAYDAGLHSITENQFWAWMDLEYNDYVRESSIGLLHLSEDVTGLCNRALLKTRAQSLPLRAVIFMRQITRGRLKEAQTGSRSVRLSG